MSVKVFTNAGADNSWATAGNWAPSGVPASNDIVLFIKEFPASVTGGLNQGGIDLDLLWVQKGYTGNIGSSGTSLQIAADKILYEGDGDFYLACDAQAAALKTDVCIIKAGSLSRTIQLNSQSGDAGEIDFITLLRGKITLAGALTGVNRLEIGHVTSVNDVNLTIDDNATAIPLVIANAGIVDARVPVTDLYLGGGTWTHQARAVTNLYGRGSGRYVANTNSTMTLAKLFDNFILDALQSFNTAAGTAPVKTFTELWLTGQSEILRPADTNLVTITSYLDLRGN